MIKSISIYKGERSLFTNKLYNKHKSPRTFNFTPGLNIVTGRNGSGKTVLLNLLKNKTGNLDSGEISPSMMSPMKINKGFFTGEYYTIDDKINKKLSGTLDSGYPKVDIDWDGKIVNHVTPAFFGGQSIWKRFDSPKPKHYDELFSGGESLLKMMSNLSAGEDLINTIIRIKNLPKEYHGPMEENSANDLWINASNIFQDWVKIIDKGDKNSKPTLLIDELDKHLDLDNQLAYFNFIKELAKEWQIILVSHSYFAFKLKDVNYINLDQKYFNTIKNL